MFTTIPFTIVIISFYLFGKQIFSPAKTLRFFIRTPVKCFVFVERCHPLNVVNSLLQVINGAGHHVYLDKPDLFNKFVLEACARGDANDRLALRSAGERTGDAAEQSAASERSAAQGDERSGDQAEEREGTPERTGTNTPAS